MHRDTSGDGVLLYPAHRIRSPTVCQWPQSPSRVAWACSPALGPVPAPLPLVAIIRSNARTPVMSGSEDLTEVAARLRARAGPACEVTPTTFKGITAGPGRGWAGRPPGDSAAAWPARLVAAFRFSYQPHAAWRVFRVNRVLSARHLMA